jgi:hypothetical protein
LPLTVDVRLAHHPTIKERLSYSRIAADRGTGAANRGGASRGHQQPPERTEGRGRERARIADDLIKQYAEFGLPYPIVGFNLNTADAWAAGESNLSGTWPTVWHHDIDGGGGHAPSKPLLDDLSYRKQILWI